MTLAVMFVFFGFSTNLLNIIIIFTNFLRKSGIYVVLLALCISDTGAMLIHGYNIVMRALGSTATFFDLWSCRFFTYFWYSFLQWSSWCTVLVSLIQMFGVLGSADLQQVRTTPRRATTLVIGSAVLIFGYNFYLLHIMQYEAHELFGGLIIQTCKPLSASLVFQLHFVMYALLPYLLVFIFNCVIIHRVRRASRRWLITGNLLALTFTSVSFIVPYSIIFFMLENPRFHLDEATSSHIHLMLRDIGRMLLLANHTLVHPLYIFSSPPIRQRLSSVCARHRRHSLVLSSAPVYSQLDTCPESSCDADGFNSQASVATNTSLV